MLKCFKSVFQKSGMLDRSRMGLCLFLLAVFVVNPFGPLVQPKFDYEAAGGAAGRSILGIAETNYSW